MACRSRRRRVERVAVLPVHFSWMWEFPLRITSLASGACTNLWLKCRVPRCLCQHRLRFQLTAAPLSSLEQPPKDRIGRLKLTLLRVEDGTRGFRAPHAAGAA